MDGDEPSEQQPAPFPGSCKIGSLPLPTKQPEQPIAADTADDDASATYDASATTEITASYRDYSRYLELGGDLTRHKKCDRNFPARVHRMVSNPDHSHIIHWLVRRSK